MPTAPTRLTPGSASPGSAPTRKTGSSASAGSAPTRKTGSSASADAAPTRIAPQSVVVVPSDENTFNEAYAEIMLDNEPLALGIEVGMWVSGTGIAANTRVTALDNATPKVEISANPTASAAAVVTFSRTPPAPTRKTA